VVEGGCKRAEATNFPAKRNITREYWRVTRPFGRMRTENTNSAAPPCLLLAMLLAPACYSDSYLGHEFTCHMRLER
jgi:hypothetical protein